MITSDKKKPIRTTVPIEPETYEAFKRMSEVSGVSMGRAIGSWLEETKDAALMIALKMEQAKREPARVLRELELMTEGAITIADEALTSCRKARDAAEKAGKEPFPPSCNTGGKPIQKKASTARTKRGETS
jgi:hypothetical protein